MPTSVPNLNFLAPLVTEIWRGSQNKNWELLISSDAPKRTHYYMWPEYLHMPTSVPNFNFLPQLVSEIWGGYQN